ncbi:WW domain binding protein VOPP1 isoform X2 [Dasypus novemcinctus]|uniref:WW domain binding protein VOPP1 isoform X2 n=1 Tax=Dasypus novemcinctus TaxID=9361 RepID=UPI00265E5535|nr:vesicular, overexpressed in cancer, prosurvival protein 1 isoform X3 [Dasypus novemcinctus]
MSRLPGRAAALLLGLLVEMPLLRGLLRLEMLRAGPLHTEALVLLVPPHDGRALLLRRRLLHPEAHVPPAADRGAGLQRVLHQAAPQLRARSPAARTTVLHRPQRPGAEPRREPRGRGPAGAARLAPRQRGLPAAALLL